MLGWALIAAAPFVGGRIQHRRAVLGNALVASIGCMIIVWGMSRSLGLTLPTLSPSP